MAPASRCSWRIAVSSGSMELRTRGCTATARWTECRSSTMCATMMAAALARMATLKTSRGWTIDPSSWPRLTSWQAITRFLVVRHSNPKTSAGSSCRIEVSNAAASHGVQREGPSQRPSVVIASDGVTKREFAKSRGRLHDCPPALCVRVPSRLRNPAREEGRREAPGRRG
jgi:hypothetical protein